MMKLTITNVGPKTDQEDIQTKNMLKENNEIVQDTLKPHLC